MKASVRTLFKEYPLVCNGRHALSKRTLPPPNAEMSGQDQATEYARAQNVCVHFGGLKAVDDVSLELSNREILGLIGPNGAGKTTLVNALSGFQRLTAGQIVIDGRDVTTSSPEQRAQTGLVRTFQNVRLFAGLSVLENVQLGAIGVRRSRGEAKRHAWELIELMGLEASAGDLAGSLPHGDARRLGIARALAARPRFLLLDEPAAGLDAIESEELVLVIRSITAQHSCGVLLIEHDMQVIMQACERIQVLNDGRTIAIGSPEEVRTNPRVLEAYLGPDERRPC